MGELQVMEDLGDNGRIGDVRQGTMAAEQREHLGASPGLTLRPQTARRWDTLGSIQVPHRLNQK